MCPSLIEIGSKTAEKNSAQTNRHYENNGHLAVNQFFTTQVLVNFHFRLQFLQSMDELLTFMQTWGFAISFATCQPGNRSEYCPFGAPGTQSTTPFLVIGSLYWNTSGINEYSSTRWGTWTSIQVENYSLAAALVRTHWGDECADQGNRHVSCYKWLWGHRYWQCWTHRN